MTMRAFVERESWGIGHRIYLFDEHHYYVVGVDGRLSMNEYKEGDKFSPMLDIPGRVSFEMMRALALAFVEAGFLVHDPDGKQKLIDTYTKEHITDLRRSVTML